jgi:hypothetical protein
VKKEAMESSIEEQLRDKEAVQAENAAQQALCLQHEAEVRAGGQQGIGDSLAGSASCSYAAMFCVGTWACHGGTCKAE